MLTLRYHHRLFASTETKQFQSPNGVAFRYGDDNKIIDDPNLYGRLLPFGPIVIAGIYHITTPEDNLIRMAKLNDKPYIQNNSPQIGCKRRRENECSLYSSQLDTNDSLIFIPKKKAADSTQAANQSFDLFQFLANPLPPSDYKMDYQDQTTPLINIQPQDVPVVPQRQFPSAVTSSVNINDVGSVVAAGSSDNFLIGGTNTDDFN